MVSVLLLGQDVILTHVILTAPLSLSPPSVYVCLYRPVFLSACTLWISIKTSERDDTDLSWGLMCSVAIANKSYSLSAHLITSRYRSSPSESNFLHASFCCSDHPWNPVYRNLWTSFPLSTDR